MDTKALVQKLIQANINVVLDEVLPLIQKDYVRVALTEGLERLNLTLVALLDSDPNDAAQVKEIWSKLGSDPQVLQALHDAIVDVISTMKEDVVKEGLNLLVNPLVQTLSVVSDDVKPDGDQIKEVWVGFIKSPELLQYILTNAETLIDLVIKSAFLKRILLAALNLFGKN